VYKREVNPKAEIKYFLCKKNKTDTNNIKMLKFASKADRDKEKLQKEKSKSKLAIIPAILFFVTFYQINPKIKGESNPEIMDGSLVAR